MKVKAIYTVEHDYEVEVEAKDTYELIGKVHELHEKNLGKLIRIEPPTLTTFGRVANG
jgi:hypothetical protein